MVDEPLVAGWRDATFLRRPGRAQVRHIAVRDGDEWFARCVGGRALHGEHTMPLDGSMLAPAAQVHPNGRCRRPGCRVKWPAEYAP